MKQLDESAWEHQDLLGPLMRENRQLRGILRALPDISFVLDTDGRYLDVIGGSNSVMYADGQVLRGKRMHDVLPTEIADSYLEVINEAVTSGELQRVEYTLRIADVDALPEADRNSPRGAEVQHFEGRVVPLRDHGHNRDVVLWVAINVTEHHRMHEALRRLATIDSLTGLANRATVLERATEEIERAQRYEQPLAILMIDLDRFKRINDEHGHQMGDRVLTVTAEAMRERLRRTDEIGRVGGEEFLVVLPMGDAGAAEATADELRAVVRGAIVEHGLPEVTLSIGGALLAADENLEQVIHRADEALYEAKRSGGDRYVPAGRDGKA